MEARTTNYELNDSANLAFRPFCDLQDSFATCLMSKAIVYWLRQTEITSWLPMMLPFGATRQLLKAGGLDRISLSINHLETAAPIWHSLHQKYSSKRLTNNELIFWIQLLLCLGFTKEAANCINEINQSDLSLRFFTVYLKNLIQRTISSAWRLEEHAIEFSDSNEFSTMSLVVFSDLLVQASYHLEQSKSVRGTTNAFARAEEILAHLRANHTKPVDIVIAESRLLRYKGYHCLLKGSKREFFETFDQALASLDTCLKNGSSLCEDEVFLLLETKRRCLDRYLLGCRSIQEDKRALDLAKEAVRIDPFCARALMLAGDLALHESCSEEALSYYSRAADCGILERSYCQARMGRLLIHPKMRIVTLANACQSNYLDEQYPRHEFLRTAKEILKDPVFSQIESIDVLPGCCKSAPGPEQPIPPIGFKHLEEKSRNLPTPNERTSIAYQRFLPYWELSESTECAPILCHTPLLAREVLCRKPDPRFETLYTQRAMVSDFRHELHYSISHNLNEAQNLYERTGLNYLRNRSVAATQLFDYLDRIEELSALDLARVIRVVSALGYNQEALQLANKYTDPKSSERFDIDYWKSTTLHIRIIQAVWENQNPEAEILGTYARYSQSEESLRIRLTTCIAGIVSSGQIRQESVLLRWRVEGFQLLHEIQESERFSEFEKALLTSRFYRAACYYPFIRNDHATLREEMHQCENWAWQAVPTNSRQSLLKRENLFPMLETMARCWSALGEKEKAVSYLQRIVLEIDGWDSKAWLQLGDALFKARQLESALDAFLTAGYLYGPLARVAYYRAGTTFERLGDLHGAKICYLNSLRLWPRGTSPLLRLVELGKGTSDQYLCRWATAALEDMIALTPDIRPQLKQRIHRSLSDS